MDLTSVNNNLQMALNDWIRSEYYALFQTQHQPQQQQQQGVLNGQALYITMPENPLLEPVDLTHHCECIGEPLTPMLPVLTKEWIEKCEEYQNADGNDLERMKQIRSSSWQTYLTHDSNDIKRLLMNIYLDDYNQRLLDIHHNEKRTKKHEEQRWELTETNIYQQQQQFDSSQAQSVPTSVVPNERQLDHSAYHCEDLEKATRSPTLNRDMQENNQFLERSADSIKKPNEKTTNFMDIPEKNKFRNQLQHHQQPPQQQQQQQLQQQQQQPKKTYQTRGRRNRNRNRKYQNETPMLNSPSAQSQALQPTNNTQNFEFLYETQPAALPTFPNHYQADWRKWMEYLQRPPFYLERSSAFYGTMNDGNQQILNLNMDYPYLQNQVQAMVLN